jgi:hypothetical protein
LRKIIKTHRFEHELRDLKPDAREADDFIEAAEWTLSRDAEIGSLVTTGSGPVWFLAMIDEERVTPVALYYTFDAGTVYFLSVRRTPKEASLN